MLRNLFSRIKEDLKEDFKQDPAKKIRTVQKINAARPKDIAKEKVGRPFPGGKRPLFWASLTSVIRKMSITALPAAVDVGTSSIKLLQLGRGPGDEITIIALDKEKYSQPVPPDPVPSQREALKRIIKRNRIGPKVIVSLAAHELQVYNLTFPPMSEKELKEAIQWKIIQLKPFGLGIEGITYDFIKWDSADEHKILVVCASKAAVSQKMSLLKEVGLKAAAIEMDPFALGRLSRMQGSPAAKGKVGIWLDLGSAQSFLVIERDGLVCFLRNLTINSQHITKHLAERCRISEAEAEDAKQTHGLSFWSPDQKTAVFLEPGADSLKPRDISATVFYGMVAALENFVVDIEHSFKYFSYQVSRSQVTRFDYAVLSGGGASLKNLDAFLSARLGVPVTKADPFAAFVIPEDIKKHKADFLKNPCDFTVAAGLAGSALAAGAPQIHLLSKTENKFKVWTVRLKRALLKALVLPPIILIFFMTGREIEKVKFYEQQAASAAKKVKDVNAQSGRLQSQQLGLAQREGELSTQKNLLETKLDFLHKSIRKSKEFSVVLARTASLVPEEIWVNKLSYKDKRLIIAGSSSNTQMILDFIENLKASDDFSDVTFGYSQKEPGAEIYNFEVSAGVKQ